MKVKDSKILIIDDQVTNLKLLRSFLSYHNFEVRIAENGERALQVLEHYHPDIILLDVMMPGIDGFETCRRIKADKRISDIPVIFITALVDTESKISGFEAGGVDYITKPFQQAEVLVRLDTHLTLQRQKLELEQALADVKTLSGLLSMCSFCKKIRDDNESWMPLEEYIASHSQAQVSHGLCPECIKEHYKEYLS